MQSFSIWHWLIVILGWWLAFGWPTSKILRRMGFSGWWTLLSLVPLVNIVAVWILATARWPLTPDPARSRPER